MDSERKPGLSRRATIGLVVGIAVLVIGLFWWQAREADRRTREQLIEAQGIARVLSATFAEAQSLKVGEVKGRLDVTSVDPGLFDMLPSSQAVTVPYTVDYQVDLNGLNADQMRWDAEARTLMIEIPNVVAAPPNVDETQRVVRETTGLFVTRGAADNLSRRASRLASTAASREAAKAEHLDKARANARVSVARLIETPLAVAGIDNVKVVVRFPQDGYRDGERWDVSPSIRDVLENAKQQGSNQ